MNCENENTNSVEVLDQITRSIKKPKRKSLSTSSINMLIIWKWKMEWLLIRKHRRQLDRRLPQGYLIKGSHPTSPLRENQPPMMTLSPDNEDDLSLRKMKPLEKVALQFCSQSKKNAESAILGSLPLSLKCLMGRWVT